MAIVVAALGSAPVRRLHKTKEVKSKAQVLLFLPQKKKITLSVP